MESPVSDRFYNNCMLDVLPQTAAERVDFGFNYADDEIELFCVYRNGLLQGDFTREELYAAVGNGPALTELLQRVDPSIIVETDYDFFVSAEDFVDDDDFEE